VDYNLNEQQKFFGHYIISSRVQPGKNLFFPGASGKTPLRLRQSQTTLPLLIQLKSH
jgi:hypothetical protein